VSKQYPSRNTRTLSDRRRPLRRDRHRTGRVDAICSLASVGMGRALPRLLAAEAPVTLGDAPRVAPLMLSRDGGGTAQKVGPLLRRTTAPDLGRTARCQAFAPCRRPRSRRRRRLGHDPAVEADAFGPGEDRSARLDGGRQKKDERGRGHAEHASHGSPVGLWRVRVAALSAPRGRRRAGLIDQTAAESAGTDFP
jgi:hypothetical protein